MTSGPGTRATLVGGELSHHYGNPAPLHFASLRINFSPGLTLNMILLFLSLFTLISKWLPHVTGNQRLLDMTYPVRPHLTESVHGNKDLGIKAVKVY